MEWIIVAYVLIGNLLMVFKKWQGFVFWIIADIFYAFINFEKNEYAQCLVFSMYAIFSLIGVYIWLCTNDDANNFA